MQVLTIGSSLLSVCLSVCLCVYLSIYSPSLGLGRFFSLLIFYTVSRTPWTGDHPVARPLPAHMTTQTQNKRTHTSMPWMGFEPLFPAFERAKRVHASHSRPLRSAVRCYLSVWLSVCLSVCLSFYLSIYLSIYSPSLGLGRFFSLLIFLHS
jgi:hypothetical protein